MSPTFSFRGAPRSVQRCVVLALLALVLAACSTPMPPDTDRVAPSSGGTVLPQPQQPPLPDVSQATNPRAYRQDAARHLYALNTQRIFHGKLPPLLYAVGVLQVDIDARGAVRSLNWMRAPSQAPEVVAEIERTVRAAAPFPRPAAMGQVTYTDVWLWDKSGQFQLDTLTEGQLGEP